MDQGEVWEAGTPEQIFEHPRRPETYGFVFSVRSWEWELAYPDNDHPAMEGSLTEFCSRQFVGRRLADACQHVVEELSSVRLASIAREVGASGVIATFTLYLPKSGEAAMLEVDCHNLVDWGIGPEEVGSGGDPVSEALIAGYARRVDSDDPAVICYEIG